MGKLARNGSNLPETFARIAQKLDWGLVGVLLLALLLRAAAIIEFPSLHHPDENFQLFEQGHRYFLGTGIVPWEFSVGVRSPVLPFLLGLIFAGAEPLVGGPEGYLLAARLLLALSSLAAVAAIYRMGRRISPVHALLGGFVTAVWFELVYFAGRPLTEAIAATVLLTGLSLASVPERELAGKRLVYIGFCFGLCLMLRAHLLPGILVASIWIGRSEISRWKLMAIGASIPIAVFGVADAVAWGTPFFSYFEAVRVNLFQGVASKFGTAPFDWYVRLLFARWSYATPVLLLLVLLRARTSLMWILVALAILLTHALIPHKEYRFVLPAFACLVVVAALGSADLVNLLFAPRASGTRAPKLATFAVACAWAVVSALLAFAPTFRFQWLKSRDLIEAEFLLARQAGLCGVLLEGFGWFETGGYSHLDRQVPLYELPERSNSDAARVAGAFNAVILKRSLAADFPKEYSLLQCFGWVGDDDACVVMRDGNCTSLPGFAACRVTPVPKSDPSAWASDPCFARSNGMPNPP